ncbi:DUF6263 family protein [Ferruginibacter albus]|uniref:DUF6263 family protein n=1 Tax=Ferruginibacter albus TaxID=2875540 RepID=UPI001CC6B1A3|nr:DUF6263 family protein [Ferruginibacter albus]UAY52486.1 hypothetical protein K9M53_02060 [Ferruginibacter albus]
MRLVRISILSLLLSVFCYAGFSQAYTIKMRMNVGDTFNYATKMDLDMNMPAQDMTMTINADIRCLFKVLPNDSMGFKQLQMTYKKMKMRNSYLSAHNSDSAMDIIENKFVGRSIVLKLSKDNQVMEVVGLTELLNNETNETYRTMAKNMFSKEQVSNLFGMMFSMYPSTPVKIGDSWKSNANVNINGINMIVDFTYSLLDVKDNLASIGLSAVISSSGSISVQGTELPLKMDGDEKGTLSINMINGGYMHNANYTMGINAEMQVADQKFAMILKGNYALTGN